jgi:hypothetical protein
MDDLQRENYIRGSQNAIHLCLPMDCVYGLLPDTSAACVKGEFTIPSS